MQDVYRTARLSGLEGARGVAALLVVMFHSGVPLFRFGHCGVDFFFVLSGFIVFYAHERDLGDASKLKDYLAKRAIRIYPLYWSILMVLTPIGLLMPSLVRTPGKSGLWVIANSFILFPMRQTPVLGVAWSLEHEMFFYVCFSIVLLKKQLLWVVVLWGLSPLLVNVAEPNLGSLQGILYPDFPVSFLFSLRNLGFALGIVGGQHFAARRRLPYPGVFLALGVGLFLGNAVAELTVTIPVRLSIIVYLLASALIIRALAELELVGKIQFPMALTSLGAASYALYLVHFPIIAGIQRIITAKAISVPVEVSLSIAVAVSLHRLIEVPAMRALSTLSSQRPLLDIPLSLRDF